MWKGPSKFQFRKWTLKSEVCDADSNICHHLKLSYTYINSSIYDDDNTVAEEKNSRKVQQKVVLKRLPFQVGCVWELEMHVRRTKPLAFIVFKYLLVLFPKWRVFSVLRTFLAIEKEDHNETEQKAWQHSPTLNQPLFQKHVFLSISRLCILSSQIVEY